MTDHDGVLRPRDRRLTENRVQDLTDRISAVDARLRRLEEQEDPVAILCEELAGAAARALHRISRRVPTNRNLRGL